MQAYRLEMLEHLLQTNFERRELTNSAIAPDDLS